MHTSTPSQLPSSSDTPSELVRRLILSPGGRLSARTRRFVLDQGEAAVPVLLAILGDESLDAESAPGEGYARERAAMLLGELRAAAAIAPMLAVLRTTDPLTPTHEAILEVLPRIGAAVLEPVLVEYASSTDPELHISLASILSRLGMKDPRILPTLLAHLHENPEHGAMCLGELGDPAALPALSVALDAQVVRGPEEVGQNHCIIELAAAIEELGGTLTRSQEQKLDDAEAINELAFDQLPDALTEQEPVRAAPKLGRNERCICGSGKKYKKCCGA